MCMFQFFISLLPGILWMWYIYKSDKFEPEPVKSIILVFALGFFAVFPTILVELGLSAVLGQSSSSEGLKSIGEAASSSWIVAGVVEEVAKFLVVLLVIYRTKDFNEPLDGIVYSSAAALGFASLENYFYMLSSGTSVILIRGPLSTLGHLLFSAIWGYGLGRGKMHPHSARRLAFWGLVLGAFAHGLYDFILFSSSMIDIGIGKAPTVLLAFLFVAGWIAILWLILKRNIKKSENDSPFNPKNKIEPPDNFDDNQNLA
jgi:protease PrsW